MIPDVDSQKAILRNQGKCFVCFRSGHKASECKSTNKCFNSGPYITFFHGKKNTPNEDKQDVSFKQSR